MNWKFLGKKSVYRGKFAGIEHHQVDRGDGSSYHFEYLHFNNNAVGIIPFSTIQKKILLVKQFRYYSQTAAWEIPAGGIDGDEPSILSAQRELEEETGYLSPALHSYFTFFPSIGGCDQKLEIFLAPDPIMKKAGPLDPIEIEQTGWFDYASVKKMILEGEIHDGLTLSALGRFYLEFIS